MCILVEAYEVNLLSLGRRSESLLYIRHDDISDVYARACTAGAINTAGETPLLAGAKLMAPRV